MKRYPIIFSIIGLFLLFSLTKTGRKFAMETWTTITNLGTNLVAKLEGYSGTVYRDIAGFWTIGYGHKIKPGENFYPYGTVKTINHDDAKKLLTKDMQQAADVVNKYVVVPLNENQFNALVSFVYNTSSNDEHIFANSTLLKKLNSGDYQGAADELNKWVYAGGKISNGLIARRETEKNLFLA